jgi:hypothetical protein
MADEWENELRSFLIFDMMTYRNIWPMDATKLDVIDKYVAFFPNRGPATTNAWLDFIRWYHLQPKSDVTCSWLGFCSFIQNN